MSYLGLLLQRMVNLGCELSLWEHQPCRETPGREVSSDNGPSVELRSRGFSLKA